MAEIPTTLIWKTALVPVVVSLIAAVALSRNSRLSPASAVASLAIAFIVGWATQEWAKLAPSRYIDWLPYACGVLGVVGSANAFGLQRRFGWPIAVAACALASWWLVPNFPRLQPPRPQAMAGILTASVVLIVITEPVAKRLNQRLVTACLMATGTAGAIVLAQSFGMKLAQTTGILTAGLAGGLLFTRARSDTRPLGTPMVFLPMLCNLMFMGHATSSSEVPVFCYALVPIAPVALWIAAATGTESQTRKRWFGILAVAAMTTVLAIAVVPALLAHPPWEEIGEY